MARAEGQPCRLFHKWNEAGLMNITSLVYRCSRCGWWKVWNGITDSERLHAPDDVKEN